MDLNTWPISMKPILEEKKVWEGDAYHCNQDELSLIHEVGEAGGSQAN